MLSTARSDVCTTALYPGAFDPVHLGHVDVARRAAALFDRVIVAVFERPGKKLLFSGAERIDLFRRGVADIPNVEVQGYGELTIHFARARGAGFIIRGLRTATDFEYEYQLNAMNRHLEPGVETVFLMTSLEHAYLSSSLIKEIAAEGGPLDGLVPEFVAAALRQRYHAAP